MLAPPAVNRTPRPAYVTWAVAAIAFEAAGSLAAYVYAVSTIATIPEILSSTRTLLLPLPALLVSSALIVLLLLRKGWSRYCVALLCALTIPDLLPLEQRALSTIEYPLALAVAWPGFALQVLAAALLFSPSATTWFKSKPSHARTDA